MSSLPQGTGRPSLASISRASRCASSTPRRWMPTRTTSVVPWQSSRSSEAMRVSARAMARSSSRVEREGMLRPEASGGGGKGEQAGSLRSRRGWLRHGGGSLRGRRGRSLRERGAVSLGRERDPRIEVFAPWRSHPRRSRSEPPPCSQSEHPRLRATCIATTTPLPSAYPPVAALTSRPSRGETVRRR